MYVVILAGGGGTRLWPLSRRARPKPFVPLLGDRTLFQRTVARVLPLAGRDGIYVVVERRHVPLVREQAPDLPAGHVLAEPEGRNTAAAIALATLAIERPLGEVMLVLPADAWIGNEPLFREVIRDLAAPGGLAEGGGGFGVEAPLVTLGTQIDPDHPETGYGHLVPDLDTGANVPGAGAGRALRAYRLERFVEKPDLEQATVLARTMGVAWNAGMFAWRRRAILEAFEAFAPDILGAVRDALLAPGAAADDGPLAGHEAARRYAAIRAISIDYAVMEPAGQAGRVVMTALDAGWSDVGSWDAVAKLAAGGGQAAPESAPDGPSRDASVATSDGVLDLGSRDTFVWRGADRLIVTVGLSDTIVVDTPDALLVCAADHAQDVRAIVDRLKNAGETDHL